MVNLSWSLIVPIAIALAAANAAIMICIQKLKNTDGPVWKMIWPVLMTASVILGFVGAVMLAAWVMYVTPAHYFFEGIDGLVNGVVNQLPKPLLIFYFGAPLILAYLIYIVLATVYDHKKRKNYLASMPDDYDPNGPTEPGSLKLKWSMKLPKFKKRSKQSAKKAPAAPSVADQLASYATTPEFSSAIDFRRFTNDQSDRPAGTKIGSTYFLVAGTKKVFDQLKAGLPTLLDKADTPADFPVVVKATEASAEVLPPRQAVNAFRHQLKGGH